VTVAVLLVEKEEEEKGVQWQVSCWPTLHLSESSIPPPLPSRAPRPLAASWSSPTKTTTRSHAQSRAWWTCCQTRVRTPSTPRSANFDWLTPRRIECWWLSARRRLPAIPRSATVTVGWAPALTRSLPSPPPSSMPLPAWLLTKWTSSPLW